MIGIGDVLQRIASALEAAGIPYMIAGSLASTHYSIPRSTYDIDIVIEASEATLRALVERLSPDAYYVDLDAAQFNVIDMATGWKVDLIIRKDRPFSIEELSRRQPAIMFGVPVFVATAEDTVVAKLEWASAGGSDRQLRDVREIVDASGDRLDVTYIERWVGELGLQDAWLHARTAR